MLVGPGRVPGALFSTAGKMNWWVVKSMEPIWAPSNSNAIPQM